MVEVLVLIAFVLYAVRYAFSGVDNALVYNEDAGVPDIHDAEQAQNMAATGGYLCLLAALWMEADWGLLDGLGLLLSLAGAIMVGDYWFNKFIYKATGVDTKSWRWPLLGIDVPKVFAGRRWLQPLVAVGLFGWGIALWMQ